jgi:hypothetical protein
MIGSAMVTMATDSFCLNKLLENLRYHVVFLSVDLRVLRPYSPTPVNVNCRLKYFITLVTYCYNNVFVYSERQKYGINSLKIKQNFFQKNLWTGQF